MKNITIRCAGGELALSKIIMGTCPFGTGIPEDKSVALLNEYAGLGGATLDTAAVYGDWEDKRRGHRPLAAQNPPQGHYPHHQGRALPPGNPGGLPRFRGLYS